MMDTIKLPINDETFGKLYPYIIDDLITDIRWNGRFLMIEHLTKGYMKTDDILSEEWLSILTKNIATSNDLNFNPTQPSLDASTDDLRFHVYHPSITGENKTILSIRKTPAVARITEESFIETNYGDLLLLKLLNLLIASKCSGFVIGETGAGKTELIKLLAKFIPDHEVCLTVEDTFELRLPVIYPNKNINSIKVDKFYSYEKAIRDALRSLVKYLFLAEARGREITRIVEGASTGCSVWTTIHADNTWEVISRVKDMTGTDKDGNDYENRIYTFFDCAIKVKKMVKKGSIRRIDQICFFERTNEKNQVIVFYKDGKYTGNKIPKSILDRFNECEQFESFKKLWKATFGGDLSAEK